MEKLTKAQQLAKDTEWVVKDLKKKSGFDSQFMIEASNGYDGIMFDKSSLRVIDAEKGIIQMRFDSIIGA